MTTQRRRFLGLFQRLGGEARAAEEAWRGLEARYQEPHRAYHNLDHIQSMLEHLDAHRDALDAPELVEAAIWYHDAIYDTHASDNEARSAELAATDLDFLAPEQAQTVRALIMATLHDAEPPSELPDAAWMIDIDLSVLGGSPEAFAAYDEAIREEYRWVPRPMYRAGRAKVLRGFLERESVFNTPAFRDAREARARRNLQSALEALADTP